MRQLQFACMLSAVIACGCAARDAGDEPPAPETASTTAPVESEAETTASFAPHLLPEEGRGLHNVIQVSARIFSGSQPRGDDAFENLADLGVKTVVSVDGAVPDVEAARRAGLRYAHIPIGYDGIPAEAGLALARLVNEADGPIYLHCHHGHHRGPAAAAVACIAAGETDGAGALELLKLAGTSRDYAGLWRDVEGYTPPEPGTELPQLVEVAEIGSLTAAMVKIDRASDNLERCRDAVWATPEEQPDVVPAQEALLMREGLHEAARNLADDYDDRFKTWMKQAAGEAVALEDAIAAEDHAAADNRLERLKQSCKRCHSTYRD